MILLTRAPTFQEQFQTPTAIVKFFLFKPDSSQGLAQRVLNTTTKDCDSPDVRDRAYIYWRLISADPGAAKVQVQFLDYRSSYSFRVILLRQSVIPCTSATDVLTSYHCCACATERANRGNLESSERVSEASYDIYRSRLDRRRVNAAQS